MSLGLWAFAACAAACGHSHSVGDGVATTPTNTSPPKDNQVARKESAPGHGGGGKLAAIKADERPDAPLLATSPEGLMKPHAVADIQDKLAAQGRLAAGHQTGSLDQPTREALRVFQRDNGLPATGVPDDLTVRRLGLNTADVFRAATDPATEKRASPPHD